MWLARFSGAATRCRINGSTSWSSIGAVGGGVRRGESGFGVLQVRLGGVLSPDRRESGGGVEAAGDESDGSGDDYRCARRRCVEPRRVRSVGCAEADGREECEDDDEVGQVPQRLRELERGELRGPHEVDRDLAGDRVTDGDDPEQADALLAEERHDDHRGER